MSGVEVAGVVLGAFPLLLSALEQYKSAVDAVRKSSSSVQLRSLQEQIVVESEVFKNSCEHLLSAVLDPDKLAEALSDPIGALWRDPGVESNMKDVLGHSYELFFVMCESMISAIGEVKRELDKVGKSNQD